MKQKYKRLLNGFALHLSTVNRDGTPETRAMINIHNKEIAPHLESFFDKTPLGEIYFITNTSSDKMAQIAKNDKASVYMYDGQTYEGLIILGAVAEVKDQKLKDTFWHDSWKVYYPAGKDGGDFSILKFSGREYKFYTGDFKVKKGKLT
jgi:general stress protein 26